jgi:hypothetical protein
LPNQRVRLTGAAATFRLCAKEFRMTQTTRRCASFYFLPLIGSLVACAIFDPTYSEPARIIFYGDTALIMAPDTVTRGTAFEVSVETFGGGCTRSTGRTDVRITGLVLEIRPYNETRRSDVCTDDLIMLTHQAFVQFSQPGVALVRVVGAQEPTQGAGTGSAEVTRQVVIR